MNTEHLLHIPCAQKCIFPFVPMCSLPPEAAPLHPCWWVYGNKGKLGAKEGCLCFPNHINTFLLFLYGPYMLFKVHVSRRMGSSLLKEIGINNKYNFMKMTQGKTGALGRNAVNCCLPVCFNPSCPWKSNSRRAAAQRSPGPLGALQTACPGLPHPWQPDSSSSYVMNILITHKPGLSVRLGSMARMLSSGMWVLISASLSAGMEGRRVGFGIPGERPALLAQGHWSFVVLHPTPQGREPQPPNQLQNCQITSCKVIIIPE